MPISAQTLLGRMDLPLLQHPLPGERNMFERTFNLKLGGRPPEAEINRVKVTLWARAADGEHELQTVVDVPGFDNNYVRHDPEHPNDDRMIVTVTHHRQASTIASTPPQTHATFYVFEVTATSKERQGQPVPIRSTPRMWRMPPNLFGRYSSRRRRETTGRRREHTNGWQPTTSSHAHQRYLRRTCRMPWTPDACTASISTCSTSRLLLQATGCAQYVRLLKLMDQAAAGGQAGAAALATVTDFVRVTREVYDASSE